MIKKGIICKKLSKAVKGRQILSGVSLKAKPGQVVALLGPNGAGKTTCFSIVSGLIKPDSGSVFFDDEDVTELPMYKRARMGMGYLPQEASIFRGLNVEDNILAVLAMNDIKSRVAADILDKLLKDLSLEHIRKISAVNLSGGERRKLEIARALALNPSFILLDEPLAGIDPIAILEMRKMIQGLKNRGIGIIITDHNVRDTLTICDYAYILFEGRILVEGTANEVINDKLAKSIYLGDGFSIS